MAIPNATLWRGGQRMFAADMNGSASAAGFSYGVDYLAGRHGITERENSQVILSGSAGGRYLLVPRGTTAPTLRHPACGGAPAQHGHGSLRVLDRDRMGISTGR